MHTHSLSIHPDPGRALRPWELALLLAVCVTLLTGTWAQARSQLLAARLVRLHVIAVSDDDAEQAVIVDPGGDPDILKDGDELMLTQPAVVLEQLIGKFLFNAGSEKDKDAAPQPPASDGSNP